MADNEIRSKVFISCGQSKITDEVEIAHQIAERINDMGYEPYVAVEEQTLKGVKENIFSQIETSEYFIFIDFKRERILGSQEEIHRGSLFSHQELALASYLEIQLFALQENGVKKDDGLLRFLQGNCTAFTDRHHLPSIIADGIVRRGWRNNWKNALSLHRDQGQYSDARIKPDTFARFFHICVKNLHLKKHAINCYVYLESVIDTATKELIPIQTVEFKWAGYVLPNACILANSYRLFDAFFVIHQSPNNIMFNIYTDSGHYVPRIEGSGDYEFTYIVISENFPLTRDKFKVHIGNTLEDIKLIPAD